MNLSKVALLIGCVGLTSLSAPVFAQNTPGVPGGILSNSFQLNPHPQMPFAASAPSNKFQGAPSEARRRADNGDPDGCNLKCPPSP